MMISRIMSKDTTKIPLTLSAHKLAHQLASKQTKKSRIKPVYLNSLAVYAVKYYLETAGFNPIAPGTNSLMAKFLDVADLEVENLGKIECRFVLPDQSSVTIPDSVKFDRIAYVVVGLDESLEMANILGFTPKYQAEISLDQLLPLDELLTYLNQQQPIVKLLDWLKGNIDETWQSLKDISLKDISGVNQPQLAFRYGNRSKLSLKKGKIINLGVQLDQCQVCLIVELDQIDTNSQELELRLIVESREPDTYLPMGLELTVMGEEEEILTAVARDMDNVILLDLDAELGEEFTVTVSLGETKVIQKFIA